MTTNNKISYKNYIIKIIESTSYILKVSGMPIVVTELANIRLKKISIAAIALVFSAAESLIDLKKIVMSFGIVNLIYSITQTISLKTVTIAFGKIEEVGKISSSISISSILLSPIYREIVKSISNMNTGYLSLILSPLIGTFAALSVYDPQTLSALDSSTLADMDLV